MNAPKPVKTLAGQSCPACRQGHFRLVQTDHVEQVAEDNPLTIPDIWVDRCDHCDEVAFPGDTVCFIESVVADHTEQLTPRELERIRDDLGVPTQDEMSEILGLGTKTYHKWESGVQFPTRSMSNYIRLLAQFPEAFEWLKARAWRQKNRLRSSSNETEFSVKFPDLTRSGSVTLQTNPGQFSLQGSVNPPRGLMRVPII